MWIIKHRTIFFILSGLLVLASLAGIIFQGLRYSIDFTGGSLAEVSFVDTPILDATDVLSSLSDAGFGAQVQQLGESSDNAFSIRTEAIDESNRTEFIQALTVAAGSEPVIDQMTSIGPSIGRELRLKAILALLGVSLAIIVFVAWAFRSVRSEEGSSRYTPSPWLFGLIAVVALLHDIIIPTGISALLGLEISPLFVVGLLSILGLSVNDTIVVFDRIRENVIGRSRKTFDENVGLSLMQTITRSVNTSLTLVIALIALYFLGPESTQPLALVMIIGTIVGTYSSIFLASPLLVEWFGGEGSGK